MNQSGLTLKLIQYLLKNPSIFIDISKMARYFDTNQRLIDATFSSLEAEKIGQRVYSYKSANAEIGLVNHFKFYFNDFNKYFSTATSDLRLDQQGALLEQYFYSEIVKAHPINISTFRTIEQIEVDFIITTAHNNLFAVEIKKDQFIYAKDLQGLHYFNQTHPQLIKELFVLHKGTRNNKEGIISVLPIDLGISIISSN